MTKKKNPADVTFRITRGLHKEVDALAKVVATIKARVDTMWWNAPRHMKRKRAALGILLVTSLTVVSCGLKGNARHTAVIGNVGLAESLFAIQSTADTLLDTKQITIEQRQTISKALLPALETGRELARVTAGWPEDKPAPAELAVLVPQLRGLVDAILVAFPDSPAKSSLVSKIAVAQTAAMALLLAFTE